MRLTIGLLLMTVALMPLPGAARADDRKTVACDETDFKFGGQDFKVACAELPNRTVNYNDGSAGVSRYLITADAADGNSWLASLDSKLQGQLAVRRSGIQDNIHTYFSDLQSRNWRGAKNFSGFEVQEFTYADGQGLFDCVGFQRYMNRRYDGYSRWVVGVSCSTVGVDDAYKVLAKLDAPGD